MDDARTLGALLIADGVVTERDVAAAVARAARDGSRLGSALVAAGAASADAVAVVLARQLDVLPARDIDLGKTTPAIAALVPAALARRLDAVPLGVRTGTRTLVVAMRDPRDLAAIDELAFATGHPIAPAVAVASRIRRAVDAAYPPPLAPLPAVEAPPPRFAVKDPDDVIRISIDVAPDDTSLQGDFHYGRWVFAGVVALFAMIGLVLWRAPATRDRAIDRFEARHGAIRSAPSRPDEPGTRLDGSFDSDRLRATVALFGSWRHLGGDSDGSAHVERFVHDGPGGAELEVHRLPADGLDGADRAGLADAVRALAGGRTSCEDVEVRAEPTVVCTAWGHQLAGWVHGRELFVVNLVSPGSGDVSFPADVVAEGLRHH